MLQPTADLGGRQQTLAGKKLMMCTVTTPSLLGHPWAWQSSAFSLKLDELINKPGKFCTAASSIIPVSFSRRLFHFCSRSTDCCVSLPLYSVFAVSLHRSGEKGSGWHWHGKVGRSVGALPYAWSMGTGCISSAESRGQ